MRGMSEKVLVSWSGGKDSALALNEVLEKGGYDIQAFITTVSEEFDRISMHGVRRSLLARQAASLQLPLREIILPPGPSNREYEAGMEALLAEYKERGVSRVIFGDVFLEDVRAYREKNLARVGMEGIFPLWGSDTGTLANTFIELGFKAVVTCVDSEALDGGFVGRDFDEGFLSELPEGVDPSGENGEFHTFVYDGPIFKQPITLEKGEVVLREHRFCYIDLVPLFVLGNEMRNAGA
jgi:uncharacterized protein (TIGR00290 family)